jgi:hypothetical protein
MSVVLAVRAGYIPISEGNVTINYTLYGMQALVAAHFGPSFFFVVPDGSYGNNS